MKQRPTGLTRISEFRWPERQRPPFPFVHGKVAFLPAQLFQSFLDAVGKNISPPVTGEVYPERT